jgi:hypothetical protein
MNPNFERWRSELSQDDLKSFEALCFHKADVVAQPYTALLNAPKIIEKTAAAPLIARAWENSKEAIQKAYQTENESGPELFARAVAPLFEWPGCVPSLISVIQWQKFDFFECNIQQELGGPYDTTFSGLVVYGLTWDWFHFFEDPLGPETSISLAGDHLTEIGLEFAQWLWPERIEKLRRREEA